MKILFLWGIFVIENNEKTLLMRPVAYCKEENYIRCSNCTFMSLVVGVGSVRRKYPTHKPSEMFLFQ